VTTSQREHHAFGRGGHRHPRNGERTDDLVDLAVRDGAWSRATMTIEQRPEGLSFTVADDGAGFDPAGSGRARPRLRQNMSDRVGAIGGTLEVDSAPGQGTRVSGVVPIDDR
jgi:signal transduction histidine kinase